MIRRERADMPPEGESAELADERAVLIEISVPPPTSTIW